MKSSDFQDVNRFEVVTEHLTLLNDFVQGQPRVVSVFKEKKTEKAYQVDFRNRSYRVAQHVLERYGAWQRLED